MKLREPVAIVAPVRTAIGKLGGMFAGIEPHHLLANCIRGTLFTACDASDSFQDLMEREKKESESQGPEAALPLDAEERAILEELVRANEVLAGCVRNGIGNIARVAALQAGFPVEVPAATIDRQCASSMEALAIAAAKISSGMANKILVGGVESASQAPWMYAKTARPYSYFEPQPFRIRMSSEEAGDPTMGETAEILADEYSITREEMDAFAAESHARAARATDSGEFAGEIWAVGRNAKGIIDTLPSADECIRPETTPEILAKLRPVFRKDGRVTAGNSSPLNDAATSAFAMSEEAAARVGVQPAALLKGVTVVGCDPNRMGLGPAYAIPKLLQDCGLTVADIDLFEINEAFAAQVLAVLKELDTQGYALPADKLNVDGGAIALGHPLGATGLRLVVTLIRALRRRGLRRGVAALCVGGGQGMAVFVEIPG